MTETEAKKRWCPMIQHHDMKSNKCITTGCMAWRWILTLGSTGGIEIKRIVAKDGSKQTSGYCGLAGNPDTADH